MSAFDELVRRNRVYVESGGSGPPLEVAVVHHTQCGSSFLARDDFRRQFAGRTGFAEADLLASAVTDPHATVRTDVARLLSSPLATQGIVVSGHVFDLQTGLVETVLAPAAPHSLAGQH
jgi:carbonic anhydrase